VRSIRSVKKVGELSPLIRICLNETGIRASHPTQLSETILMKYCWGIGSNTGTITSNVVDS
jgi:hypothetical protein